jgi:hypothetical protein
MVKLGIVVGASLLSPCMHTLKVRVSMEEEDMQIKTLQFLFCRGRGYPEQYLCGFVASLSLLQIVIYVSVLSRYNNHGHQGLARVHALQRG